MKKSKPIIEQLAAELGTLPETLNDALHRVLSNHHLAEAESIFRGIVTKREKELMNTGKRISCQ